MTDDAPRRVDVDLVLEILTRARHDAPVSPEDLTRRLTDGGLAASDSGAIADAVGALWASQTRLQRRTRELEGLYSTARELVQLHDVDVVLQRLVERAHGLIGTDVTYLSEALDGGDLRVRYSVGTVSPAFRDLRVPAGVGLASRVAQLRAPVWVERYDRMREAPHDPTIDAAVRAEGLVAFLGVPLAVGDQVLGALFACNRFDYEFTPDEVLLLSAFADHAAAVLNTARMLREIAAVGAEAERANRELESHIDAMERTSVVHEQLAGILISGGDVADVTATISAVLETPVWVLDETLTPLGEAPADAFPDADALADAVHRSRVTGHCEVLESANDGWLVAAIVGSDTALGAILTRDDAAVPHDIARRTLERAADTAALLTLKREAATTARSERRARALLALLDGDPSRSADIQQELATLAGPPTVCAVFRLPDGRADGAREIAARIVDTAGLVAVRDRHLIVAWGPSADARATEQLRDLLGSRLRHPVSAVLARIPDTATGLRDAVGRGQRAADLLPALDATDIVVSADELLPYQSLLGPDEGSAARFVDAILGPVIAWDARRGTDLVATLIQHFAAGESRGDTAAALHVHKNTVQQRLDRIQTLTGGDWSDSEWRFRVHAAARVERLRRSLHR